MVAKIVPTQADGAARTWRRADSDSDTLAAPVILEMDLRSGPSGF